MVQHEHFPLSIYFIVVTTPDLHSGAHVYTPTTHWYCVANPQTKRVEGDVTQADF